MLRMKITMRLNVKLMHRERAKEKVRVYNDVYNTFRSNPVHDPGRDEPSFIAEASFVKAPLNSRVVSSSVVSHGKGKAKQESLDRLPLELQEALILEDLLFVLMVCHDPSSLTLSMACTHF